MTEAESLAEMGAISLLLCCFCKKLMLLNKVGGGAVVGLSLSESLNCRRCYEKDKEKWRRGKV